MLLVAGLVALLFGIQNGPQRGWLVPETVASVGLGSALLGAFVVAQRRSRDPMVDFTLFQLPAFRSGLAVALLTFVAMASNMFLVPFMLQGPVGLDARAAGWVMLAVPLTILGAAPADCEDLTPGARAPAHVTFKWPEGLACRHAHR